jgi:FkbM family methyltransferase
LATDAVEKIAIRESLPMPALIASLVRRARESARRLSAVRVPILAGPLRGMTWTPGSRGKLLRIFLGTYERAHTQHFVDAVKNARVVFDVGACVGYYTLLASRLVGQGGVVYSFEPSPHNLPHLRNHVAYNRLTNVTVFAEAIGAESTTARFKFGGGPATGHLAPDGNVDVRVRRLDDVVQSTGIIPDVLKIDVEGGEVNVLDGARESLTRHRPILFLSTHGPYMHSRCLTRLNALGYQGTTLEQTADGSCEMLFVKPHAESQAA